MIHDPTARQSFKLLSLLKVSPHPVLKQSSTKSLSHLSPSPPVRNRYLYHMDDEEASKKEAQRFAAEWVITKSQQEKQTVWSEAKKEADPLIQKKVREVEKRLQKPLVPPRPLLPPIVEPLAKIVLPPIGDRQKLQQVQTVDDERRGPPTTTCLGTLPRKKRVSIISNDDIEMVCPGVSKVGVSSAEVTTSTRINGPEHNNVNKKRHQVKVECINPTTTTVVEMGPSPHIDLPFHLPSIGDVSPLKKSDVQLNSNNGVVQPHDVPRSIDKKRTSTSIVASTNVPMIRNSTHPVNNRESSTVRRSSTSSATQKVPVVVLAPLVGNHNVTGKKLSLQDPLEDVIHKIQQGPSHFYSLRGPLRTKLVGQRMPYDERRELLAKNVSTDIIKVASEQALFLRR